VRSIEPKRLIAMTDTKVQIPAMKSRANRANCLR
jgi:hypothetical protein